MSQSHPVTKALLTYYHQQGRKTLPWQIDSSPYHVWVSEIMLQQTQVKTVIDYYQRFIEQFASVSQLADAGEDDVMQLWAGLGYYSRARNLHKAAKQIKDIGCFPDTLEGLTALSGIGRSTAGAILSFAFNQPAAVLDGNVKRVLSRVYAIEGDINAAAVSKTMWTLIESLLPKDQPAAFNQATMDLGALVCTRSNPKCQQCPLSAHCVAFNQNRQDEFPHRKTRVKVSNRALHWLIIQHGDRFFLEKRTDKDIWQGLWCFPAASSKAALCQRFNLPENELKKGERFEHILTHRRLQISPYWVKVSASHPLLEKGMWLAANDPMPGVPRPVAKTLSQLKTGNLCLETD